MAIRANYWTCSKLADKIRGTIKPKALEMSGWSEWKKESKKTSPIRYWIAEEGLDYLQDFIYWPYDQFNEIRYYINNRWITKSHALTAHPKDIKPGKWCDVGYRFLPCLFNELVDFVEIECAYHHVLWDDEAKKKYETPWWRTSFLKFRKWRCPEAGIAYFEWASTLTYDETVYDESLYGTPTPQAVSAIEVLELYRWWKDVYPNRPDPYDASGWTELCDKRRTDDEIFINDKTPEQKAETKASLDELHKLEQQYEQEDEDMMIRLIKVRLGLWT
jgi:hypothetical protein